MDYEVVAGWTGPIDIHLLSAGAVPAGTMAGMTAEIILRSLIDGSLVTTTGDLAVYSAASWIVRWNPDAADLVPGKYRGRIKVTDGTNISYFPSGDWDTWTVRSES